MEQDQREYVGLEKNSLIVFFCFFLFFRRIKNCEEKRYQIVFTGISRRLSSTFLRKRKSD